MGIQVKEGGYTPEQLAPDEFGDVYQARFNNETRLYDVVVNGNVVQAGLSYEDAAAAIGQLKESKKRSNTLATPPSIPGASSQPNQPISQPVEQRQVFGTQPTTPAGPRPVATGQQPADNPMGDVPTNTTAAQVQQRYTGQGGVVGADPGYVSLDYSRYDQAAGRYETAMSAFEAELDRLNGVDPFGNQAFLRQATDRAVAQAQGLAAGGLSTATARAGNMRQAQGVQAALSAQGRDQMAIQRQQDEVQASAQRIAAATGLADTIDDAAKNEVELSTVQVQVGMGNLDAWLKKYGIDQTLDQQDVESLRNVFVELQRLGEQAREADMDDILTRYGIDQQTRVALKQISENSGLNTKDVVLGVFNAGTAVLGDIGTAPKGSMFNPNSDRRLKFDVRDPDLRDLEDYLGRTKGKLYRYKDPARPGNRAGLNFGPMAQDLAKSKIGRTVVGKNADGTYHVDAARLALADHAALAALAADVRELKKAAK